MKIQQWFLFLISLYVSSSMSTCYHNKELPLENNALFYIERLSKTKSLLSFLNKKKYFLHTGIVMKTDTCILYNNTAFFHYKIVACIYNLNKTCSLDPLLTLLQEIERYWYIQNVHFLKELLMLIVITYKKIILDAMCKNTIDSPTTLETIIIISKKLDQLPIIELLNAIDMLTRELPKFLEKYEFHSEVTWKEWFKKYWWVPPIVIGWFGLKVLVEFQHRPYYYFSLSQYKPYTPSEIYNDNDFIDSITTH